MAQTDPNRRYLIAGTSLGLINDTFPPGLPPNGVIFEEFNKHGITWKDYYTSLPTLGVFLELLEDECPFAGTGQDRSVLCRCRGRDASIVLPGGTGLRPSVRRESSRYPIRRSVRRQGRQCSDVESQLADDHADMDLRRTRRLLRPRRRPQPPYLPTTSTPVLEPGDPPGGFDRYGFRVPSGVVSPFAKEDYVSHTIYDHTSILKTVEEKWNLPALTRRDANANSLFDMVDLHQRPSFPQATASPSCRRSDGKGRMPQYRRWDHSSTFGGYQGLMPGHRREVQESPGRRFGRQADRIRSIRNSGVEAIGRFRPVLLAQRT